MTDAVAAVVSVMILLLGISYLIQSAQWIRLVREAAEAPHRFFPTALLLLVLGVAAAMIHNFWSPAWRAVITAIGWLLAVKGASYLAFPQAVRFFAGWSDRALGIWIRTAGAIMAVVGILLCLELWSVL